MAVFRIENYRSSTVNRKVALNVILPFDSKEREHYDGEKFKTLYLLHGVRDNANIWIIETRIQAWAEKYNIAVVMPHGENSFYLTHGDEYEYWDEYVGREIVEMTRRCFPLSHKREDTWIGGFSMGGYGALRNGLKYHDTFSKIFALAPGLDIDTLPEGDDVDDEAGELFFKKRRFAKSHYGNDIAAAKRSDMNPIWYVKKLKEEGADIPKLFIATGTEDPMAGNGAHDRIVKTFEELGLPCNHRKGPGGHDWVFVNSMLEPGIKWLAED